MPESTVTRGVTTGSPDPNCRPAADRASQASPPRAGAMSIRMDAAEMEDPTMRYTVASLFTLLVVGMASAVPDDPARHTGRLPAAPLPMQFDVVAESVDAAPSGWVDLRPAPPQPSTPTSADAAAGVEGALHELAACANTLPEFLTLPGSATERATLVWIGDSWMLSDARVAAPVITRRGTRSEARSLVVLKRHNDRFVVDEVLAFEARNHSSPVSHREPLTGLEGPG